MIDRNAETDAGELESLLRNAVQAFDSDDPAQIEPLLSSLAERLTPTQLAPTLKALEDFDFRSGERALHVLAESLDIFLEQHNVTPTRADSR
jgi:two-component system sensor histidine kinase/response regulator